MLNWLASAANCALVVVGIVGVIIAIFTLRKVERQTKATEIAAQATKQSVEVALTQTQVMKDRERAILAIRGLDIPELLPSLENEQAIVVTLYAANEGATKAFHARAYAVLNVVSSRDGERYEIGFQQEFPNTIANTDNATTLPKIKITGLGWEYETYLHVDTIIERKLRLGELFLQVSGLLIFTDIYEDSHEVPFRFVWVSAGDDDGGHWLTRSTWYDLGVTKADIEADRQDENPN
ncbi:MAG: hypothetical protein WA634_05690 [Silvibacterium sp.]